MFALIISLMILLCKNSPGNSSGRSVSNLDPPPEGSGHGAAQGQGGQVPELRQRRRPAFQNQQGQEGEEEGHARAVPEAASGEVAGALF